MSALVEVHDRKELETALKAGAQIIGINNRNLKTFETRLEVTFALRPYIPEGVAVVSESGISTPADVRLLIKSHVNAMLVGEYLMCCPDIQSGIQTLLAG
jgi:indole-3-glycerol phosphate synthase